MSRSGLDAPARQRVVVLSADPAVVASLRADGRVWVVAHVEEPSVAAALAASSSVDAILADEPLAAGLPALDGAGGPGPGGRTGPPVFILRPQVDWRPASAGARGQAGDDPAAGDGRTVAALATPGRDLGRDAAGAGDSRRDHVSIGDLREWRETRPVPGPVARPEVLMRQAIAVISPKGGVGKTFVSVNLAVSLARHTGFRVVLVDLDLRSGDASIHLDLMGRQTLAELGPYLASLETAHLARAVVTHAPSHLDALLAPARPEAAEMLGRGQVGVLVQRLKQVYDFVIVDTPPDPADPLVTECLGEATAVVLVSSLDAAALRHCRLYLDAAATGNSDLLRRRFRVVLNQVHDGAPLPAQRAASFLEAGLPGAGLDEVLTVLVPEDRAAVERAVFDGRPLVLTDPGHPASRAIFELAQTFCPVFGGLIGDGRPKRTGLGRLVEVFRRW